MRTLRVSVIPGCLLHVFIDAGFLMPQSTVETPIYWGMIIYHYAPSCFTLFLEGSVWTTKESSDLVGHLVRQTL
jgi:hypothetical protein